MAWLVPSTVDELCAAVRPGDAALVRRAVADGGEVTLLLALDGAAILAQVVRPDDTCAVLPFDPREVVWRLFAEYAAAPGDPHTLAAQADAHDD